MKPEEHGGDLLRLAELAGRAPEALVDFSVNVRPEGPPEFLREALCRSLNAVAAYPSPHAEEAMLAAGRRHGKAPACFAFGNGSNELIHALARVLKKCGLRQVCVLEPAFSEYALACRQAGLSVKSLWGGLTADDMPPQALLAALAQTSLASGSAVFLANPGNPSGLFRSPHDCLALLRARADLLWILDEAFIEYAGPDQEASLLPHMPGNAVILRSLTKFHALPGLRLGYLAAAEDLAQAVRAELPAWNVNAMAMAVALAVFADESDFAAQNRAENARRRADLHQVLSTLPQVGVWPSAANYLLFHCPTATPDLPLRLLRQNGLVLRGCANYYGLRNRQSELPPEAAALPAGGGWFRAAVRFFEDHALLGAALQPLLAPPTRQSLAQPPAAPPRDTHSGPVAGPLFRPGRRPRPALMLQGVSSNAGKSLLAAAFCRIFYQDGWDVAPFKAQNMSLNSGVTAKGEEMGRAQIVQARAARLEPEARMNPVLLKPQSDTGSQVVVLGQATEHLQAAAYYRKKDELWRVVRRAYDELAAGHELMVLEGAGSPAEINLKAHDIVNMRMAAHAQASVLLVGDIDRGGLYASFLGTWLTFTEAERRLLRGYVVNKFRGDASLLAPAHSSMLARTGVPVLGVVPWISDVRIPEEDMAGFSWASAAPQRPDALDLAVVLPGHLSNGTDFEPLALEPDVRLRPVRRVEDWGKPQIVFLPGSKSVARDLEALRACGLADKIQAHAAAGGWIFGICGGLQMLGTAILDPEAVESSAPEVAGLGLMELRSSFARGKTLLRVERGTSPLGLPVSGYEIHHGRTLHGPAALPLFRREGHSLPWEVQRNGLEEDAGAVCGYVTGRCWATYLHGIFDDDVFRRAWLDHVRADLGLAPVGTLTPYDLEKALDRLADLVRAHVDVPAVYRSLGLNRGKSQG